VRFIYFITWEKAQVFNCPPSASQIVGCNRPAQNDEENLKNKTKKTIYDN
jgi:hypothetical protein